jgi:DNA-directed RNA polymerase specialized sigma24 family protein
MPDSNPSPGAVIQPGTSAGLGATHWSVVLAAGDKNTPERRAALETLCRSYWLPIYNLVRRGGYDAADAQDLTQAFFVHLLTGPLLAKAHPARGRFRCLLAVSLKHFLINDAQRARAAKRGGEAFFIPLDESSTQRLHLGNYESRDSAEAQFDRQWALTVLDHAFDRLREEWKERGKRDQFDQLKVFLSREGDASDYAAVGKKLSVPPKSVPVTVHRLRRRYGLLIREEVAQTVSTAAEVEGEVRYLLELVGAG